MLCVAVFMALPAKADTLFEDFGGEAPLRRIVDYAIDLSVKDPLTADTFKKSDIPRLKNRLYDQLCELMGGPCTYKGPDMKKAHIGLGLTQLHFNKLVEQFRDAMDREDIGFRTQNRLLAMLAPMAGDVIER